MVFITKHGLIEIPDEEVIAAARARCPSALPLIEPQGHCQRSRLATCSLPVSIVAAAALSLRVLARSAADARDGEMAMRLADALSGRAEAVCANERQPEENVRDEPRHE